MAIDITSPRSRRSLITAALGGVAAAAWAALGSSPASAADGDRLILGHVNRATTTTYLRVPDMDALHVSGHQHPAVHGESDLSFGVVGYSPPSVGVFGVSKTGRGVMGDSTSDVGVFGRGQTSTGVFGFSGLTPPVALANTGVHGQADLDATSVGVRAVSAKGRGAVLEGGTAQLRLVPAAGSHPPTGKAGDLFMDHANRLWLCKGGTSWHQLA